MPVSFRSKLLTSYILTYLSSKPYSCKYDKLSNILIHACTNITETNAFLKMCGPRTRLCLFTFPPIASKQLNSLTTIDSTHSWFGGAVVTHPLWVQDDPGSIPGSGNGFHIWFFVLLLLLLCFYFLSKITLFVTTFCNSFCNVNLYIILITL